MEQFTVPEEKRVRIDYYDKELAPFVKALKSLLFKQGATLTIPHGF